MSKIKQIALSVLTVILGAALGFIIVFATVWCCDIISLLTLERFFAYGFILGVAVSVLIICRLSDSLYSLHIKINQKLHLPHWALIVITCIAPIIYSVYYRIEFIHKVERGEYNRFLGIISYATDYWASIGLILGAIAFLAARIITVWNIKHSEKSKNQEFDEGIEL